MSASATVVVAARENICRRCGASARTTRRCIGNGDIHAEWFDEAEAILRKPPPQLRSISPIVRREHGVRDQIELLQEAAFGSMLSRNHTHLPPRDGHPSGGSGDSVN